MLFKKPGDFYYMVHKYTCQHLRRMSDFQYADFDVYFKRQYCRAVSVSLQLVVRLSAQTLYEHQCGLLLSVCLSVVVFYSTQKNQQYLQYQSLW